MVFDKQWFHKHQRILRWFANTWLGRYVFRIHGNRSSVGKNKIVLIEPNSITWIVGKSKKKIKLKTEFRTRDKFAKRLFYTFKPFWYLIHGWDMIINQFKPAWNLGFDTLTAYPDANPETATVDGYIRNIDVIASGWAAIRNAATGTDVDDVGSTFFITRCQENGSEYAITRSFLLFDTSALPDATIISSAVLSVYVTALVASSAYNTRLCTTTPASNTALAVEDYDQIGSTAQATDVASGSITTSAYNNWTLNATGISNVSKTGITKFGFRDVEHDIDNSAPGAGQDYRITIRSADFADVTSDPKLVVTHSLAVGHINLLLMGVG